MNYFKKKQAVMPEGMPRYVKAEIRELAKDERVIDAVRSFLIDNIHQQPELIRAVLRYTGK